MANRTNGSRVTTAQSLAVASQFGISLAVAVILGYFVGQWLDAHLGTNYILTVIGVLLGLIGAATNTVRLYRSVLRRNASDASDGEPT